MFDGFMYDVTVLKKENNYMTSSYNICQTYSHRKPVKFLWQRREGKGQ